MSVLERWIAANSSLKQAALEFLEASASLDTTVRNSTATDSDDYGIEKVVDKVQKYIDSVPLAQNYITQSQTLLHGLLNQSVVRVPIGRLGPETLSQIFAIYFTKSPCMASGSRHDSRSNIMLVCARWHRIVINNPLFWSHIDITLERWVTLANFDAPRRWLDRSRGVPLHIHIEDNFTYTPVPLSREEAFPDETVSLLEHDLGSITTLAVYTSKGISIADTLFDRYPLDLWKSLRNVNVTPFTREYVGVPSLPMFEGLLELCLDSFMASEATILGDMLTILSKCPQLHTLRLTHLTYRHDDSGRETRPTSVIMPHLTLIEVDASTSFVLSLLGASGLEIDLRLSYWYDPDLNHLPRLELFISQSRVVTLTLPVSNSRSQGLLSRLMKHLNHLSALRYQDGFLNQLSQIQPSQIIPHRFLPQLPSLRFICFVNAVFSRDAIQDLQKLIDTPQLSCVAFLGCSFSQAPLNPAVFGPYVPEDVPDDLRSSLASLAQQVVAYQQVPNEICHGVDFFVREMMELS
ncbi:pyrolysin [Ceratobasidium sp. AG-Ba]|nr:pyrolysin [Ceratobasidium sp. AG-Ba]